MIPVDKTLAGRVADVHHLLPDSGLTIIGEHFLAINHALLGIKGAKIDDLEFVHSHIHAIPQCKNSIKEMGVKANIHADTAGAAAEVAEKNDKKHGAIASCLAAQIYGLDILKENLQDAAHNTTRFLILSNENTDIPYEENKNFITSIVFKTRNIPAALYKALGGFATNGISLAKLESYVSEGFKVAQFYCEVEGYLGSHALKLAIEELEFFADEVKLIGCYKAHEFRDK